MGLLPRKGDGASLIPDFLRRAGLSADGIGEAPRANRAYPSALIQGVHEAIEAGFKMPGPHRENPFFGSVGGVAGSLPQTRIMGRLKAHADTAFESGNLAFAQAAGLDPAYFEPSIRIEREEILEDIAAEAELRRAVPAEIRERERAARIDLACIAWAIHWRAGRAALSASGAPPAASGAAR